MRVTVGSEDTPEVREEHYEQAEILSSFYTLLQLLLLLLLLSLLLLLLLHSWS